MLRNNEAIECGNFDKEKLAEALLQLKGDRSINAYAKSAGVNSAYISRLLALKRSTPPSVDVLWALSEDNMNMFTQMLSYCGYEVTPESLMSNTESYSIMINKDTAEFAIVFPIKGVKYCVWFEKLDLSYDLVSKLKKTIINGVRNNLIVVDNAISMQLSDTTVLWLKVESKNKYICNIKTKILKVI